MGRHQRGQAADGGPERSELHFIESGAMMAQGGEGEVAVEVGVAMSWEMLPAREHSACVKPIGEGECMLNDQARCVSERAVADHWVVRVGIDVEHWSKVQVEAEGA
jgi:hypothetical protein